MKVIAMVAALAVTGGCSTALRGPETCTEIHFETTYVLARWAGWPEGDALRIAAADAWTDQHAATNSVATERRILGGLVNPLTIPRVILSGLGDVLGEGAPPRRAFGSRVAEATAWAVPSLGHRLHFPARGIHSPVTPAFYVNPATGEVEYGAAEGRRVLERAFLDLASHDEDGEATLALLGIGLHVVQDSFKHGGFDAALGHIGARPDPDDACLNLPLTLQSAEVTLSSLRYARRLAAGRSSPPPAAWKELLSRVIADGDPQERWTAFLRESFREELPSRDALLVRWRKEGGDDAFERAVRRVEEVLQ